MTDADRLLDAKLYITQAYWSVLAMRPWRFGRKDPPAQFLSVAQDEVTVLSIAGPTVTLAATLTPSRAGRKFFLDNEGIPHRIASHVDGTAVLTLVTDYSGDDTSGAGTVFQDELAVATDILAFPRVTDLNRGAELKIITEGEFHELYPRNINGLEVANQRYGTFLTDGKLRIAPWTFSRRLFECTYSYRPAALDFSGAGAGDTPIIPVQWRAVIAWKAEENLLRDRKEDARANALRDGPLAEMVTQMQGADLTWNKARAFVPRGHRIWG